MKKLLYMRVLIAFFISVMIFIPAVGCSEAIRGNPGGSRAGAGENVSGRSAAANDPASQTIAGDINTIQSDTGENPAMRADRGDGASERTDLRDAAARADLGDDAARADAGDDAMANPDDDAEARADPGDDAAERADTSDSNVSQSFTMDDAVTQPDTVNGSVAHSVAGEKFAARTDAGDNAATQSAATGGSIASENPTKAAEPSYTLPDLPGDVYSFAAQLDDVVYSLPAPFAVFAENGWSAPKTDLDKEMIPGGGFELIEMTCGEHTAYMGFINNGDADMALSGCYIGMLFISETDAKNGTRFALPGGAGIGAGYDDIINLYGAASKRSDYEWGIVNLRYNEQDSGLELELDADSMQVININYKHYARRETLPEYTGAPPAIIDGYKAPDDPGDDWRSFTCIYGGDIYRLPAPAGEFIKNGWVFVSDENQMLNPHEYNAGILLRKDNQTLETIMLNKADDAQPLKYCYITELSYDKHNTNISLELPGGINERSTVEEIFEAYGEPDNTDTSGSMFVHYTYGTDTDGVFFTQSIESAQIVYLALIAQTAP